MQDNDFPKTGPEAIEYALSQVDPEKLEQSARETLREGKKSKRAEAVKILRITEGLKRNGQKPSDFMIHKVPVIPTQYRPFAAQGDTLIPGDENVLYKDTIDIINAYKDEASMFGEKNAGAARLAMYDSVKSLYGYGEPVKAKTKSKGIEGYLKKIVGRTAKLSYAQRRLFSRTQDNVGRSTITVDPDYGMDDIGLPRDLAYPMYAPYIQRRLKGKGFTDAEALRHTKDRTPDAERALIEEMRVRPVLSSRAPAWHKHSIIAQKPHLVDGSSIVTNPYTAAGQGADYDGDQQIGDVRCCFSINALRKADANLLSDIKNNSLHSPCPAVQSFCSEDKGTPNNMYKDTQINMKYSTGWVTIDLSDFPHGELINTNKKNGYDIEFYSVPEGTYVPAYDESTGKIVPAEVSAWSIHRGREVEIVTLADGYQIYTDDDPRAVYGVERLASSLVPSRFTPTEALHKNVLVPMDPESSPAATDKTMYYDMQACELCEEKRNEFTVELDYNFGQVIGCMCGDGWIDFSVDVPRTNLADKEYHNAYFVLEYFRNTVLPGCSIASVPHEKRDDCCGVGVTHTYYHKNKGIVSRALKALIGEDSVDGKRGALDKHFPRWYAVANKNFLRGLINGLVATDGTISVVKAKQKNKPQLMIAITSTSLRMMREAKRTLAILGVPSTITPSKTTIAGNTAWALTISSPAAKKHNLFAECCMKRKAQTFIDAEVSMEANAIRLDYVPFPVCISNRTVPYFKVVKISKSYREQHPELSDEDWKERVNQSCFAAELRIDAEHGYITRAKAKRILEKLPSIDADRKAAYDAGAAIMSSNKTDSKGRLQFSAETRDALYAAVDVLIPDADEEHLEEKNKAKELISGAVRKSYLREEAYKAVETIFSNYDYCDIAHCDLIENWARLVNSTTKWMPITKLEKTGQVEVGYDLTVPGYETFVNGDGVILSNTVNVHVPASDAAVKEAMEQLMPSQQPFSDRVAGKLVPLPKQEQVLGLYAAATAPATPPVHFNSKEEAIAAIRQGKVKLSDDIDYPGMDQDVGFVRS